MNRNQHRWIAKLSGATALILLASLALPLLAYAQSYIFQATYDKTTGTVTASVYTDEPVTGNVYLDIRNGNTSVVESVYLEAPTGTYTVGDAVYQRYDFTVSVTSNTYDTLQLSSWYTDPNDASTVTSAVYTVGTPPVSPPVSPPPSGGGYIPPYTPPTQEGVVGADVSGKVSASALLDQLQKDGTVTITLAGTFVLLPAAALLDAPEDSMLVIAKGGVNLQLPLSVLELDALAEQLDTAKAELVLRVDIEQLAGANLSEVEAAASAENATLRAPAVEFGITAIGKDDRRAKITDFGGTYVARTLPVEAGNKADLTGAMVADGELTFVPAEFVYNEATGAVTAAVLKRPGNSVYTVVERSKTFQDISEHWAQHEIEAMADKLIIEGVTAQQFEPDRSITRAEFAALLVRALALNEEAGSSTVFSDVSAGDWYAEAVKTASGAGLINGYPDGTFQPNDTITRGEMSAMIVRAITFVDGVAPQETVTPNDIRTTLEAYKDGDGLGWSRTYMAIAVKEGIINGMPESRLVPHGNATRAQAAVMLHRWLAGIPFIQS